MAPPIAPLPLNDGSHGRIRELADNTLDGPPPSTRAPTAMSLPPARGSRPVSQIPRCGGPSSWAWGNDAKFAGVRLFRGHLDARAWGQHEGVPPTQQLPSVGQNVLAPTQDTNSELTLRTDRRPDVLQRVNEDLRVAILADGRGGQRARREARQRPPVPVAPEPDSWVAATPEPSQTTSASTRRRPPQDRLHRPLQHAPQPRAATRALW